jgi:hypothetical protein
VDLRKDEPVAVTAEYQESATRVAGTLALALARVVVPAWLAAGAVLKLIDLSPSHLPAALIQWVGGNGIDLMFVLRFSIAVELIVAGVMVLLPPLARWIGVAMLTAFAPILVGDLVLGASSCGCFGALEVNPWITLVTDVTFLLGLLVLGRREPRLALTPNLPTSRVLIAGAFSVVSVAAAFGLSPPGASVDRKSVEHGGGSALPLPADGYYMPMYDSWIGRPFLELDLASWVKNLPDTLGNGSQYIIFYRKDCEHCHQLMELYFSGSLSESTTAIAVPERYGFPSENLQPFDCPECRRAELPSGIDWFLQTPVLVRLADGVVECAAEVDAMAPECLDRLGFSE